MSNCFKADTIPGNVLEINHCRKGRFECDFYNGTCVYLERGDLSVNMMSNQTKSSYFPLEYYFGVSVVIDIDKANTSISSALSDISIDLFELRDKLCPDNSCFIMRATDSIQHIFSELYTVPDKIKLGYFKLKVLELLLFLSAVDIKKGIIQQRYFQKRNVEIIKEIKKYMTNNLDRHFTLEQLSKRFDIPLTTMKHCFKGVYGNSIYAYMRAYRMQMAAKLISDSKDNISAIAGKVGYLNASKFSSAFKEIIGSSPIEYRKSNCPKGASYD